ncbi:MAG: hypothetical protein U0176_00820 [Bacteroidia bacterium]
MDGERFDLTTTQQFTFPILNVVSGTNVKTTVRVGARSNGASSSFTVKEGGSTVAQLSIPATSSTYGTTDYFGANQTVDIPASRVSDRNLNLELIYSKPTTSSVGYLDYTLEYSTSVWNSTVRTITTSAPPTMSAPAKCSTSSFPAAIPATASWT